MLHFVYIREFEFHDDSLFLDSPRFYSRDGRSTAERALINSPRFSAATASRARISRDARIDPASPLRVRARDARGNSSNELSHLISIGRRRRGAIFATFRYRRAADNSGGYAIIRVTAADAEMTSTLFLEFPAPSMLSPRG